MSLDPASTCDEPPGLYVHVPFCAAKCRYCAFYSEPLGGRDPARLVEALLAELDRYRSVQTVRTLYIGGGSPTCLPDELLEAILAAVGARWPSAQEFTVECNPGQTGERTLSMLRRRGVNRLSFGVQSFHPSELAVLGRRHSVEQAVQSIRVAQDFGFGNLGLDLIFAIPGSTLESWRRCLQSVIDLGIEHISAYSLSFEPGTALEDARRSGRLQRLDEDTDRAMYELAIDVLGSAGFEQYEISNFARPGYACLHNQGYWQNRPYIGIGPSAGSYWQGERTMNLFDIDQYVERIEAGREPTESSERPGPIERICETAVLNLRSRDGVNLTAFQQSTGADFREVFAGPLRRHAYGGWIETAGDCVRLTRKALAVADSILCDFSSL